MLEIGNRCKHGVSESNRHKPVGDWFARF